MTTPTNPRSRSLHTAAVAAAGVLLGVHLAGALSAPAAVAQSDTVTPFNAAEQRKQMIAQLSDMNQRLSRIETKLSSGLSVKVTEMPAVQVRDDKN